MIFSHKQNLSTLRSIFAYKVFYKNFHNSCVRASLRFGVTRGVKTDLEIFFNMGAGGEEVRIETKAFLQKEEKSLAKKTLLVSMEPRDR